jgi:hypothetical protein
MIFIVTLQTRRRNSGFAKLLEQFVSGFVAQLHSNNRKVAAADLESAVLQIQAASDYLQYWLANYQSADATLCYFDNSNSC